MIRPQAKRLRIMSWVFVFAWTVFIYTSAVFAVPVAREMFTYLNMTVVMTAAFAALILGAAVFLRKKDLRLSPAKIALLLLAVMTFALEYYFAERHAKRFHLIEYSILSVLLHRALLADFKGARLWVLAFMGALLIGLGDEALQHWIPERVSSWGDIPVNMKGALFGLLFTAFMTGKNASQNYPGEKV